MRRMTSREIAYYAEKQQEADKRKTKKTICHGIVALTAIIALPVACCTATEISLIHIGLFIATFIAAIYFIYKV